MEVDLLHSSRNDFDLESCMVVALNRLVYFLNYASTKVSPSMRESHPLSALELMPNQSCKHNFKSSLDKW